LLCGGLAYLLFVALPSSGFWRILLLLPAWLIGAVAVGCSANALGLLLGAPAPEVSCAACGAAGWTEDITASAGACPHCGHTRFRANGKWVRKKGGPELDILPDGSGDSDGAVSAESPWAGVFRVTASKGDDGGGDGADGGGDGGGDGGD
jgi:hypothetical protein